MSFLFGSTSATSQLTTPRTLTQGQSAQDQASNVATSLGGVTASGGKKSNVNTNITLTDPGLVNFANKTANKSFAVSSQAINDALGAVKQSNDSLSKAASQAFTFASNKGGSEGLQLLNSTLNKALMGAAIVAAVLVLKG